MNTPFSFEDTSIVVGLECISVLNNLIVKQKPSNIFIIVDRNTKQYCLPTLLCNHPVLSDSKIIEAQTGEDAKSLKSFEDICLQLIHHNIFGLLVEYPLPHYQKQNQFFLLNQIHTKA